MPTNWGPSCRNELRKGNLQGAWQLVKEAHTYSIECGVVAAGLVSLRNGVHAASEAMLSAKARMRPALDANLSILATIGSNAPFVGLLGTVLGIIKAAHEMNVAAGQNNPSAVMSGVFEALVATAVGLFVAIPAVVAYNLFERKVRTRLAQVDSLAHLLLANMPTDGRPAEPSRGRHAHEDRLMAGSISSSSTYEDEAAPLSDINVTPLVDVTLVLLIVFMITVPAIVGTAPVKVDLPESTDIPAVVEETPLVFTLKRRRIGCTGAVSQRAPHRRSGRSAVLPRPRPGDRRPRRLPVGRQGHVVGRRGGSDRLIEIARRREAEAQHAACGTALAAAHHATNAAANGRRRLLGNRSAGGRRGIPCARGPLRPSGWRR